MDRYADRVPVRTVGSGTHYDGRIWYELLKSIRSINGKPVVTMEKSMLTCGDSVTIEYKNKTYHGIVDTKPAEQSGGSGSCSEENAVGPVNPPPTQDEPHESRGPLTSPPPPQEEPHGQPPGQEEGQERSSQPKHRQEDQSCPIQPTKDKKPREDVSRDRAWTQDGPRTSPRKPKRKAPYESVLSSTKKKRLVPKKAGIILSCST
jgi:hypothetical protein